MISLAVYGTPFRVEAENVGRLRDRVYVARGRSLIPPVRAPRRVTRPPWEQTSYDTYWLHKTVIFGGDVDIAFYFYVKEGLDVRTIPLGDFLSMDTYNEVLKNEGIQTLAESDG